MPPSSPTNRKLSNPNPSRNHVERCSALRRCEPCKRRKRVCNGQRPCQHCPEDECVYSVVTEHARSVFSTNTARRLSSGSACETCRRRKTKCDGGSPCGFCASSGVECVNNSERRKRNVPTPDEAMDRIEDRLRRIEKLMTAFTPSPLSQTHTDRTRKMSLNIPKMPPPRQQRHSIHTLTKEESSTESTTPTLKQSASLHTNHMASSMLNLSLSPSSSSTSSSSSFMPLQSSLSTPTSPLADTEWTHTPIPSLMDQLSKCTFLTSSMDYNNHYPIYPIIQLSNNEQ